MQTPGAADSGPHATTATALLSGAHGGATPSYEAHAVAAEALLSSARGGGRGPPPGHTWRPSSRAQIRAHFKPTGAGRAPLLCLTGGEAGTVVVPEMSRPPAQIRPWRPGLRDPTSGILVVSCSFTELADVASFLPSSRATSGRSSPARPRPRSRPPLPPCGTNCRGRRVFDIQPIKKDALDIKSLKS